MLGCIAVKTFPTSICCPLRPRKAQARARHAEIGHARTSAGFLNQEGSKGMSCFGLPSSEFQGPRKINIPAGQGAVEARDELEP